MFTLFTVQVCTQSVAQKNSTIKKYNSETVCVTVKMRRNQWDLHEESGK